VAIDMDPAAVPATFPARDYSGYLWLSLQEGDDVQPAVISDETLMALRAATVNENGAPEANGHFLRERKTLWSASHWAEPD
jgi:hypothetical protein